MVRIFFMVLATAAFLGLAAMPAEAARCWPDSIQVSDPKGPTRKARFPEGQYRMISIFNVERSLEALSIFDACPRAGMSIVGNLQAGNIEYANPVRVVLYFYGADPSGHRFYLVNEETDAVSEVRPHAVQRGRVEFVVTIPRSASFVYPASFAPSGVSFSMTSYPERGQLVRLALPPHGDGTRRSRPGAIQRYRFAVGLIGPR